MSPRKDVSALLREVKRLWGTVAVIEHDACDVTVFVPIHLWIRSVRSWEVSIYLDSAHPKHIQHIVMYVPAPLVEVVRDV